MAFSHIAFNKLQNEDLESSLARQQMHEEGKMNILKAQQDQNSAVANEKIRADNAETNKAYREGLIEESGFRRQNQLTLDADNKAKNEQEIAQKKQQRETLIEIMNDVNEKPEIRQQARMTLAGMSVAPFKVASTKKVFRGDRETGVPREVGEIPDDAIMQTDPAPQKINITMPGTQLTPSQYRTTVSDLHRQYMSDTTNERKSMGVYQSAKTAWDSYTAKGGARDPGGQAIMVNFQKTLDPESVVRESEYLRSADGQPMLSRLRAMWTQWNLGGPGVTDEGMKAYLDVMGQWAAESQKWHDRKKARILRNAEDYGIPADRIIPDGDLMPTAAPAAPAASGPRFNPATGKVEG
jgi:hypothetical protein